MLFSGWAYMQLLLLAGVATHASLPTVPSLLSLRGGLVPQANENGDDYYEQFELDYGCNDNVRVAGSLRGMIKSGRLSSLPESDPFIRWLNQHLESGPQQPEGRIKPYYAADFGKRSDLKKGELPKIIIVNRLLQADGNGILKKQTPDIDVEVRTVWQPWLRRRCDFVARYIVPNRANIVKILESKGRFRSELVIEEPITAAAAKGSKHKPQKKNAAADIAKPITHTLDADGSTGKLSKLGLANKSNLFAKKSAVTGASLGRRNGSERQAKQAWARIIFKPSWAARLRGKKDIVMKYPLDTSKLF